MVTFSIKPQHIRLTFLLGVGTRKPVSSRSFINHFDNCLAASDKETGAKLKCISPVPYNLTRPDIFQNGGRSAQTSKNNVWPDICCVLLLIFTTNSFFKVQSIPKDLLFYSRKDLIGKIFPYEVVLQCKNWKRILAVPVFVYLRKQISTKISHTFFNRKTMRVCMISSLGLPRDS